MKDTDRITTTLCRHHVMSGVKFSGRIGKDVATMWSSGMGGWLWCELETSDTLTDNEGTHVYTGSDIQDAMKDRRESRSTNNS